jgi:GntR family transcriptional repressor for pyruvate dehydrogenase complex
VSNRLQFDPLERRTLPEEIRERIRQRIAEGQLRPGSQLPSERQLCEDFGVARTSVREAIQGLISVGLVERRGNRTFVTDGLRQLGLDELNMRRQRMEELFEVRRLIELPIVELCACRATPEQREEISALAAQFTADLSIQRFRELDREFHWSVARATGNALLHELYGRVLDALFQSEDFAKVLYAAENEAATARVIKLSGNHHKRIARAIRSGDVVAASAAIARHLDTVEERLLKQIA